MRPYLVAGVLLVVVLLENQVRSEASPSGIGPDPSDTSSIPILASGKRQHNIMRFGKRPSSGHSLIHFGKRGEDGPAQKPGHSFLYFGKRATLEQQQPSDLWDYLQKNRDGSYKRGHSIMRFGKRGAPLDTHSFIRFGRRIDDDDEEVEDLDKRTTGHSMMYFGKRGGGNTGHSMMYFGKRGNGHSMMYFGKRDDDMSTDEDEDIVDKRAHAMIHFGKRDMDEDKRAHSMIHFGKREEGPRKGSHSMIHFGKRDSNDEDGWTPDSNDEEEIDDESLYWSPLEKRQHNLLRFGKKMDRKGSHAMIHFGKRDMGEEDKRAHAMIHFGKRSTEDDAIVGNRSETEQPLSRMKREVGPAQPLLTLVRYDDDVIPSGGNANNPAFFGPNEVWERQDDWEPNYIEYGQPDKKDGGKNVFLRFG